MVLFIRRFSKLMSKQKFFKGDNKEKFRSKTKRLATIVVSMVIILLIVPMSIGKKMMTRRRRRRRRATRKTSTTRRKPMVRHTLARSGTPMMKAPTPIMMMSPP
jgi:hypothetical protein